jgi:hypothetical protein
LTAEVVREGALAPADEEVVLHQQRKLPPIYSGLLKRLIEKVRPRAARGDVIIEAFVERVHL